MGIGASQFYWRRPPNTTMRPLGGGGGGACLGASLGPGRGLSDAPRGGLQLSSAGTAVQFPCRSTPNLKHAPSIILLLCFVHFLLGVLSFRGFFAEFQFAESQIGLRLRVGFRRFEIRRNELEPLVVTVKMVKIGVHLRKLSQK